MNNETMWAIRDARGLSQDEKSLLWAIESRGIAVTRWRRLAEDAGMKKDRFYRARKSLQEKSLIRIVRKYDDVSEYTVNLETLREYLPDSHSANEDSRTENGHSHSANPQLHMSETKKNMKKNEQEEEHEGEQTTGAPVVDSSPNYEVKDESQNQETPLTARMQGRGTDAPSVYKTEDELRERRKRILENRHKEKAS